jgi:hypothetical protein
MAKNKKEIKVKDGIAYQEVPEAELDQKIEKCDRRLEMMDARIAQSEEAKVEIQAEKDALVAIKAQL